MKRNLGIRAILAILIFWVVAVEANADDKALDFAFIGNRAHGRRLGVVEGKVVFANVRPGSRTLWKIWSEKDGIAILDMRSGKFLGIDVEKKELVLFDKPGVTTIWQAKQAGDKPVKPPSTFFALIYQKVGDEELRVSSDELGKPILGGKADILHFYIDGP